LTKDSPALTRRARPRRRTIRGKTFFNILATFAERDLIRERTKDGLAATTARGRKHRLTPVQHDIAGLQDQPGPGVYFRLVPA
jgi:hypothetical protein